MTRLNEAETSRFATISEGPLENVAIHYNDAGIGETVVMIHGSGAGATSWANFHGNIDAFIDGGFRVILIDLPGWGQSDTLIVEKGSRNEINAAAVKGLLDALGIAKVYLVGNSMGGMTSLQFAVMWPDRVIKLVTMGGGPGGANVFSPMPTEGLKRLNEVYVDPSRENMDRMLDIFVFDAGRLTADMREMRYRNILARRDHLENFARSAKVNPMQMAIPKVANSLADIKIPVMAIWGSADRFVALEAGMRLLAIPDSRLHVFSRCGHWAQWEHADAFNRLTIDFLSH